MTDSASSGCCCGQLDCPECLARAELSAKTQVMDASVLRDLLDYERARRPPHHLDPAYDVPAECICVATRGVRDPACDFCGGHDSEPPGAP